MAYYIFSQLLKNQIALAMSQAQGGGFYDFKPIQKCTEVTNIPNSNTDATPIKDYRTVIVLETIFAPEDAELKAQAEALAEYYTEKSRNLHAYLSLPDAQTENKTKQQLDEILS
jgi:uncharacterized protein YegL